MERQMTMRARYHSAMLLLSLLIVFACATLDLKGERVYCLNHVLPSGCVSKSALGIDCPGCGLTRGVLAASRLQLSDSVRFHPLAWIILILVFLQIPYRIVSLRAEKPSTRACLSYTALAGRVALICTLMAGMVRCVFEYL